MNDFRLEPDPGEEEHLREKALELFLPSRPITMRTALRGRSRHLDRTLETLNTPGRSVFIFGERGVGKTSLAQTAAFLFNTSEVDPVILACHRRSKFPGIVTQIVRGLRAFAKEKPKGGRTSSEFKIELSSEQLPLSPILSIMRRVEEHGDETLRKLDPNLCVDLFNAACPAHLAGKVVVLLDEVDTIADDDTRSDLAYLVKQMGDRECAVKLILVGIGESVDALLREHESASRYMATIKLDRLSLDELRGIIVDGFGELAIEIDEPFTWRVAQISDGFAHFTHLIGLKLALRVLDYETQPRKVGTDLFAQAVAEAVEDSEASLKNAYDKAVQKYKDVYEPVLWAAADHWELNRSIDQIYQSYVRICGDLRRAPEDKRPGFYNRMSNLRKEAHGPALISTRRSWYQFRLAMLRGYCRLVAESKGVVVGVDYGRAQARTQPPPWGIDDTTEEGDASDVDDPDFAETSPV